MPKSEAVTRAYTSKPQPKPSQALLEPRLTDRTLPPSGGWIMIKRDLPCRPRPNNGAIYFAEPDRLFPAAWHRGCSGIAAGLSQDLLKSLWQMRCNGRKTAPQQLMKNLAKLHLTPADVSLEMRAKIQTLDGPVGVEPHEYTQIDLAAYLDRIGNGVTLHLMAANFRGRLAEQIFYAQSRGLSISEAISLIGINVRKPNIFWLETQNNDEQD